MRAEFPGQLRNKFWPLDGGGVDCDFVRAGADDGASVLEGSNAAAGGERNSKLGGDAANGFQESWTTVTRCRDIEDDEFVGAFGVVARSERDGIAGVA